MDQQLAVLFAALQRNRDYQTLLRKTLEDVAYRLKCLSTVRRKVAMTPKSGKQGKRRKRRPPLQSDTCFKMLAQAKKEEKLKITDGPFIVPSRTAELMSLHETLGNDWLTIASKAKLSPVACFRTVHTALKSLPFSHKLVWTTEEDEKLTRAVLRFGTNSWQEVANALEGKSNSQCYHRWMKTLNPKIRRGKWTWDEDLRLALAVKVYSTSNWVCIAEHVSNRTDIQCRERYCNVLSPSLRLQVWDYQEDFKLSLLYLALGKKWSKIAHFLPGRTDNQCWRRYKHLRKHSRVIAVVGIMRVTTLWRRVKNKKLQRWLNQVAQLLSKLLQWSADKLH